MFHGIHVICTILFFQNTDTYSAARVVNEKAEENEEAEVIVQ